MAGLAVCVGAGGQKTGLQSGGAVCWRGSPAPPIMEVVEHGDTAGSGLDLHCGPSEALGKEQPTS